mmetsp:Transcript_91537/g.191342  ORF Transcript_91537/g.191342 Transcript_91537/m.191342 type:complete len:181 (+) Transcript_91537:159-701(+)|eukprot:CAMPEP_0206479700 /NCGR_PEP_ID=MMETSP0324_2-20121206/36827_1 /ASSEMBLY_ACC=CAM_ASM_000836 /TAXON_ID=2866 /ORGANISM="Crypthecodinium cohnii, Strain Seligo" /LENGTH=180 /DNA_ID=CAMNT_0053956291 /DNA_START=147 /DNA_END=689 /DNA_ORIENTATION=+
MGDGQAARRAPRLKLSESHGGTVSATTTAKRVQAKLPENAAAAAAVAAEAARYIDKRDRGVQQQWELHDPGKEAAAQHEDSGEWGNRGEEGPMETEAEKEKSVRKEYCKRHLDKCAWGNVKSGHRWCQPETPRMTTRERTCKVPKALRRRITMGLDDPQQIGAIHLLDEDRQDRVAILHY